MSTPIRPTLFALCNRQRLPLALGLLLVSVIVLFNSWGLTVDSSDWSSGFTHPLHGADHLLAMLAVGIWAAQLRGSAIWLLPVTFVGVMSLGGLAGAAGLLLPGAEAIVLLSCLVFVALITRKIRFSSQTNVIIVAFFAFFHGFTHGQEISTSASLISYTLGFMIATLLLHGAGILVVRLFIIIFALFISHLAYAQATSNNSTLKSTAQTQTDNLYELILTTHPAPPDDRHNRLLLYSNKDGTSHAATRPHQTGYKPIAELGSAVVRVIYSHRNALADKLAGASLPVNHQPGIHFLTSGVGLASPPADCVVYDAPRFCPAAVFSAPIPVNNRSLSLTTTCYFDCPHTFYTLATSFLTNGVGATSPPVLPATIVVTPLDSNELAFGNSTPFKSSIALPPLVSRTIISGNSLMPPTRLKSRLPVFAIALPLPVDQPRGSHRSTNPLNTTNNNILENYGHTTTILSV